MTDADQGPWASPDERRLAIRSVARYSATCEAPHLTPECPFFEFTAAGDPVCAEQCMDLIARYPDDQVGDSLLPLGPGLSARRSRRTRRPPEANRPAYDARQLSLTSAGRPVKEWHIGALLAALGERAFEVNQRRDADYTLIARELEARGVDERSVLPALAMSRATAIMIGLFLHSRDAASDEVETIMANPAGWISAVAEIGELRPDDPHHPFMVSSDGLSAIGRWLEASGVSACLEDQVPAGAALLAAPQSVESDERSRSIWLMDRFTRTYLEDWSSASLRYEYQYQCGREPGCCPSTLMAHRPIDVNEVARLIADQRCSEDADGDDRQNIQDKFKTLAITKLENDEFVAAVEIFNTLRGMWPDDPDVTNNLGFCLLAVDARRALSVLNESLPATSTQSITFLNIGLAHHLVGDRRAAVTMTNACLDHERSSESHNGYLWVPSSASGEWRWVFTHTSVQDCGEAMLEHFDSCSDGECPLPFSGRA